MIIFLALILIFLVILIGGERGAMSIMTLAGNIVILFFSKKRIRNEETENFAILSIVNMIGILLDIIIGYLWYVPPGHTILYILNKKH